MYMIIKIYDTLVGIRQNQTEMADKTLTTGSMIFCKKYTVGASVGRASMNRSRPSHRTSLSLTLPSGQTSILTALSGSESCCEIKRGDDVKTHGKLRSTKQINDIIVGHLSRF